MKNTFRFFFVFIFIHSPFAFASIKVGIGKTSIVPPIGTPSAGYIERQGKGMQGVHDPLLAIALFIDNGEKQIVLCSVDHLGFTYEMSQKVIKEVHQHERLSECEIYIGSSHTHSGGGSYLNIPLIGERLAGPYDSEVTQFYIQKTKEAILQSAENLVYAQVGIGYGKAIDLSTYRSIWPKNVDPPSDVTVIKVTQLDGTPLAVFFNYALHPTILKSQNLLFSSDFVGYSRDHLQSLLGDNVQAIYFNGAQGDVIPSSIYDDGFVSCASLGRSLAKKVEEIWKRIEVSDSCTIDKYKETYIFKPQKTPFELILPLDHYVSEMNILIFNKKHAFITIPGELSCLYDLQLQKIGKTLGYAHVSILGLTNDAHGYIILPDSWKFKTYESALSFGGQYYGEIIKNKAVTFLKNNKPK